MSYFHIFRDVLMQAAIKFEKWDFLEENFSGEQKTEWEGAKNKAEKRALRRKTDGTKNSKVFQMSRTYPVFQDDAIPSGELNVFEHDDDGRVR